MSDLARTARIMPALDALHGFDIWIQSLGLGDVAEMLWQRDRFEDPFKLPGITPLFEHPEDAA